MKLRTLDDLFLDQLRDLYSAENQLLKALPRLAKAATAPELQDALHDHLEQTEGQAERLEQICEQLGARPRGKKCTAMEGLIEEAKELLGEDAEEAVRDAGLIAAAQKVEHYEIACYGCARTWARQLGHHQAADLLQQSLHEEEEADRKLTRLAEGLVNLEAAGAASGPAGGREETR
jgi:ferritin-like metal-binding protein YciE